jgi:hypothetical protein
MILFGRTYGGKIKVWIIEQISRTQAVIKYGLYQADAKLAETTISSTNILKEIASRIAKKYKEGFTALDDISEGYPYSTEIAKIIDSRLPLTNLDDNYNTKPMKCQKFKENTMLYPVAGQPKLNGLRCVLRWEESSKGEGLFATKIERAVLRSKDGSEYYLPHITDSLTIDHFKHDDLMLVYDGELYIHGKGLSYIKSSCPMINDRGTISKPSGNPDFVSFNIFDLAISDIKQSARLKILLAKYNNHSVFSSNILHVPSVFIDNDQMAREYRDECLAAGYEGCVLRELDAEYAFGFRPPTIRKYKTHIDDEFLIIDIVSKPNDEHHVMFVLKNDINNETFECVPMGTSFEQLNYLTNKQVFIGRYATVRYRERSGVKNVPFHANVIDIRSTKNKD